MPRHTERRGCERILCIHTDLRDSPASGTWLAVPIVAYFATRRRSAAFIGHANNRECHLRRWSHMTLFYRERSRYHVGCRGFTLIELLVVTLIVGILVSITVKLVGAKKHAYLAEMKSDLRNLASAEEAFHGDNFTYTGTIGVGMGPH